jgi:hypothetical protein
VPPEVSKVYGTGQLLPGNARVFGEQIVICNPAFNRKNALFNVIQDNCDTASHKRQVAATALAALCESLLAILEYYLTDTGDPGGLLDATQRQDLTNALFGNSQQGKGPIEKGLIQRFDADLTTLSPSQQDLREARQNLDTIGGGATTVGGYATQIKQIALDFHNVQEEGGLLAKLGLTAAAAGDVGKLAEDAVPIFIPIPA